MHSNPVALSNGLVGYWPLDGAVTNWNTNTTADLSGNGNTGTLVSLGTTTAPVAGKIGQALKFDGANSYVTAFPTGPIKAEGTYSFWLKPATISGIHDIISIGQGSGGNGNWTVIQQNGADMRADLYVASDNYTTAASALNVNKWTHVVFMRLKAEVQTEIRDGAGSVTPMTVRAA